VDILKTCFADNVKARRLLPDGAYQPVPREGPRVRAQERFHQQAVEAVRLAAESPERFRALRAPKE